MVSEPGHSTLTVTPSVTVLQKSVKKQKYAKCKDKAGKGGIMEYGSIQYVEMAICAIPQVSEEQNTFIGCVAAIIYTGTVMGASYTSFISYPVVL